MKRTPLSLETLNDLPAKVATPRYRRGDLSAGILHIGIGNFHRAHQAVYLDDLFNQGLDHDWALVGAGVRPGDERMRAALEAQNWLTTVVELDGEALDARVTGSMIDFVPVATGGAGILERLADPALRIVSLTVTEGGYCIDPATGKFDPDHPEIAADAANPDAPSGVFGILLAALKARRTKGGAPFTIMSCDNIPGNGHVARDAVYGLAQLIDSDLAAYVDGEVSFPNGMVDRITPATGDRERTLLQERFGIEDNWPVFCEPFRQWVLEDRFPAGRPALEEVGVTFVKDVEPFEFMKLRILNGGHAAIAYPAGLMGIHYVHAAMGTSLIVDYLEKLECEEIIPTVHPVPGVDLTEYYRSCARRFANPGVADTIPRLCQDGSNRQPKFILPTLRDRLKGGRGIAGLALETALWCRYCAGTTDAGEPIAVDDINAARLTKAALAARDNPSAFLDMRDIFGDLAGEEEYRKRFTVSLNRLWSDGTPATLQAYLAGDLD